MGDDAAETEAEDVDDGDVEQGEEGEDVGGHEPEGWGDGAGALADAGVVEDEEGTVRGEGVEEEGVPEVHCAAEVVEEEEGGLDGGGGEGPRRR
jgi:hypothetical protein